MLFDEARLEELVMRCVRKVLDERHMIVEVDKLSKGQVAALLGVSTRTVTTYMQQKKMPHTWRGNRPEFDRELVLEWWREIMGHPVPILRAG